MKGFKKGIALIAVLAFLITAILPVSALAAITAAAAGANWKPLTANAVLAVGQSIEGVSVDIETSDWGTDLGAAAGFIWPGDAANSASIVTKVAASLKDASGDDVASPTNGDAYTLTASDPMVFDTAGEAKKIAAATGADMDNLAAITGVETTETVAVYELETACDASGPKTGVTTSAVALTVPTDIDWTDGTTPVAAPAFTAIGDSGVQYDWALKTAGTTAGLTSADVLAGLKSSTSLAQTFVFAKPGKYVITCTASGLTGLEGASAPTVDVVFEISGLKLTKAPDTDTLEAVTIGGTAADAVAASPWPAATQAGKVTITAAEDDADSEVTGGLTVAGYWTATGPDGAVDLSASNPLTGSAVSNYDEINDTNAPINIQPTIDCKAGEYTITFVGTQSFAGTRGSTTVEVKAPTLTIVDSTDLSVPTSVEVGTPLSVTGAYTQDDGSAAKLATGFAGSWALTTDAAGTDFVTDVTLSPVANNVCTIDATTSAVGKTYYLTFALKGSTGAPVASTTIPLTVVAAPAAGTYQLVPADVSVDVDGTQDLMPQGVTGGAWTDYFSGGTWTLPKKADGTPTTDGDWQITQGTYNAEAGTVGPVYGPLTISPTAILPSDEPYVFSWLPLNAPTDMEPVTCIVTVNALGESAGIKITPETATVLPGVATTLTASLENMGATALANGDGVWTVAPAASNTGSNVSGATAIQTYFNVATAPASGERVAANAKPEIVITPKAGLQPGNGQFVFTYTLSKQVGSGTTTLPVKKSATAAVTVARDAVITVQPKTPDPVTVNDNQIFTAYIAPADGSAEPQEISEDAGGIWSAARIDTTPTSPTTLDAALGINTTPDDPGCNTANPITLTPISAALGGKQQAQYNLLFTIAGLANTAGSNQAVVTVDAGAPEDTLQVLPTNVLLNEKSYSKEIRVGISDGAGGFKAGTITGTWEAKDPEGNVMDATWWENINQVPAPTGTFTPVMTDQAQSGTYTLTFTSATDGTTMGRTKTVTLVIDNPLAPDAPGPDVPPVPEGTIRAQASDPKALTAPGDLANAFLNALPTIEGAEDATFTVEIAGADPKTQADYTWADGTWTIPDQPLVDCTTTPDIEVTVTPGEGLEIEAGENGTLADGKVTFTYSAENMTAASFTNSETPASRQGGDAQPGLYLYTIGEPKDIEMTGNGSNLVPTDALPEGAFYGLVNQETSAVLEGVQFDVPNATSFTITVPAAVAEQTFTEAKTYSYDFVYHPAGWPEGRYLTLNTVDVEVSMPTVEPGNIATTITAGGTTGPEVFLPPAGGEVTLTATITDDAGTVTAAEGSWSADPTIEGLAEQTPNENGQVSVTLPPSTDEAVRYTFTFNPADTYDGESPKTVKATVAAPETPPADKTALQDAVDAANALIENMPTSPDGLNPGDKYAPEAAKDAYKQAVDAAQAVLDNPSASEEAIAEALAALEAATSAFNEALQTVPGAEAEITLSGADGKLPWNGEAYEASVPDDDKDTVITPSVRGGRWSPTLDDIFTQTNGVLTIDNAKLNDYLAAHPDSKGQVTLGYTLPDGKQVSLILHGTTAAADGITLDPEEELSLLVGHTGQVTATLQTGNTSILPSGGKWTVSGSISLASPADANPCMISGDSAGKGQVTYTAEDGTEHSIDVTVYSLDGIGPINPTPGADENGHYLTDENGHYLINLDTISVPNDGRSLELPKVDGVSYSWTREQTVLNADGTAATRSSSAGTANTCPINEIGQFVYTCTLSEDPATDTDDVTVVFDVTVRGKIAKVVANRISSVPFGTNGYQIPTGSQINISNPVNPDRTSASVSVWASPEPHVGANAAPAIGVQYLWQVTQPTAERNVTLTGNGNDLTGLGSGYYLGGYDTTSVTVNGLTSQYDRVTVGVVAVVPGSVTKGSQISRSDTPEPIYLSDWAYSTFQYIDPSLSGLQNLTTGQSTAMLEGWIGQPLDESLQAVWTPGAPEVAHWIMQPKDTGATIGQEIIVTKNPYNSSLLTFTTNGPIVGSESRTYGYELIAYSQPAGQSRTVIGRTPVTVHIHLAKPYLHDQEAFVAPGITSVIDTGYQAGQSAGWNNTVRGVWGMDNRGNVYTQTKNLPSFQVLATMEGGDAKGWVQTQWAVSSKSPYDISADGVVTLDNFNDPELMTIVSAGSSQTGDLYATKVVQPSEILDAYRLNQANSTLNTQGISGTPLYYYAKVQYGSNPACARVTQKPFVLQIVADGWQQFYPLNSDGQIPENQALAPSDPEAPLPGTVNYNEDYVAEITAVVGSKAPTNLNTLWMPDVEPSQYTGFSGYTWTFVSGPAAVTVGSASVSPDATKTIQGATSQNLAVSNFTVAGRYRFICTPVGVNALPVLFEVNAGRIATASLADQAQYYGAWIQPPKGYFKDSASAPDFNESTDYPVTPAAAQPGQTVYSLGTLGSMLTIGNVTGLSVEGLSPIDGAAVPVSLNSRFQLYFDPSGIQYGTKDNGEPFYLSADPTAIDEETGVSRYWKDYVVLEWRYKTSQYMEDDGNAGNIPRGMGFSGINSPMLTSGPLTAAMDGWQFALEIHDKNDENVYTTTRWVLLDLDGMNPATQPEAQITSYPGANGSNVSLTAGSDVTFTASAQGSIPESDLTFQWQSRPAVTEATPDPQWSDIAGANESTYSLSSVTMAMSGTEYRCVVTNTAYAGGVKAISDALKLNVSAANGSVVIEAPEQATLLNYYASRTLETSVTARTDNGDPVTYEWFVKSFVGPVPTGDAAADTIDEAAALIAASGSKPVTDMPGASVSGNSMISAPLTEGVYQFTCRVVNANDESKSLNSAPVYVVVTENSRKPYISEPSAPETGVCSVGVTNGQSISLDCKAWIASDPGDGEDISYQWQTSSSADGPWNDLDATSATLTINTVTPTYTGAYFRCVATNKKANESTASIPYRLNVWNVAEVPTITNGPSGQEIPWNGAVPGNEISVTSTVTVPQGADHNTMQPVWFTPGGGVYPYDLSTNPDLQAPSMPPVDPVNPDGWEADWTVPMVSLTRTVANGVVTYTSTLSVPIEPGDIAKARLFSGSYSVTWFNNQYINEDTGYNVEVNEKAPADSTFLVAPQASSDSANVQVLISGTPRIAVQTPASHESTAAVGETASFSVTALLNEGQNENPKGELVYVWQVTKDGGATWNNALSTDGTGQFTSTFTTIPLTQEMYNNSTASNVPGAGTAGTIGNARTVYAYRCIVANRTTGMKDTSDIFNLIITAVSGPVQEPTLESAGNITIEGTAPNRYATGVTVSLTGTTVDKFFEDYGWKAPAGYSLQIVGADGEVLEGSDIVYTGCVLQLVKDSTGEVVDSATIIVRGDVLGDTNTATVGTLAVNQLVRMAQDLNETRPLDGIYEMAGDFNGNGSIDIADLVAEAQLLSLDEPVQK